MIPLLVLYVLVHAPGGHEITINVKKIIAMREGEGGDANKLVTGAVRCVVSTEDGKFVSVVETCEEVRNLIAIEEGKQDD